MKFWSQIKRVLLVGTAVFLLSGCMAVVEPTATPEPVEIYFAFPAEADFYYDEKNKEEVVNAIELIVENLQKLSKIQAEKDFFKTFFTRNHKRLGERFTYEKSKLKNLIELDPEHKSIYEQYRE